MSLWSFWEVLGVVLGLLHGVHDGPGKFEYGTDKTAF